MTFLRLFRRIISVTTASAYLGDSDTDLWITAKVSLTSEKIERNLLNWLHKESKSRKVTACLVSTLTPLKIV